MVLRCLFALGAIILVSGCRLNQKESQGIAESDFSGITVPLVDDFSIPVDDGPQTSLSFGLDNNGVCWQLGKKVSAIENQILLPRISPEIALTLLVDRECTMQKVDEYLLLLPRDHRNSVQIILRNSHGWDIYIPLTIGAGDNLIELHVLDDGYRISEKKLSMQDLDDVISNIATNFLFEKRILLIYGPKMRFERIAHALGTLKKYHMVPVSFIPERLVSKKSKEPNQPQPTPNTKGTTKAKTEAEKDKK